MIHESKPSFHLVGEVVLEAASGSIVLHLAPGSCTQGEKVLLQRGGVQTVRRGCQPFQTAGWQAARLLAPWGQSFSPRHGGPNGLAFTIDWSRSGIDPLASEPELLGQAWRISSPDASEDLTWIPGAEDRAAMITLIGDATDTQTMVAEVSTPPSIEVTEFRFEGELRSGAESVLVVSVSNRGAGNAYRLGALTRSNLPALHGLRLSFGRLRPGERKTRRLRVSLPRKHDEAEALLVLVFDEAHRYGPTQMSRRDPLRPAVDTPQLSMACRFPDLPGETPRVDAGQTLHLACTVRNEGAGARGLRLRARMAGSSRPVESPPFDLPADRSSTVTLAIDVPADAAIDSHPGVQANVSDESSGAACQAALAVEIARPQICPGGKLSREKFAKKRTELRHALDAGLISREEFERYEAELVGCLE